MKKILPIIVLSFICITLYSQGLKMGVAVEPGFSWMSVDAKEADNGDGRFSFAGGLVLDNFFAQNYAFSTGIFLGSQGGSIKYADSTEIHVYDEVQTLNPGSVVTYKLQYITVPFALKLKTNEIGYFTYFAQVGLTPQVNVKAKADASADQLNDDSINKEINIFNIGYHFGGGIEYSISQDTAIIFGIIFHNGFVDTTDNEAFRVTSKMLSFRLGVMF